MHLQRVPSPWTVISKCKNTKHWNKEIQKKRKKNEIWNLKLCPFKIIFLLKIRKAEKNKTSYCILLKLFRKAATVNKSQIHLGKCRVGCCVQYYSINYRLLFIDQLTRLETIDTPINTDAWVHGVSGSWEQKEAQLCRLRKSKPRDFKCTFYFSSSYPFMARVEEAFKICKNSFGITEFFNSCLKTQQSV